MIEKKTKKKRHHYIPQFYLKGFVEPKNKPYIWVYDKENIEIIKSSSKDIAVKKHYFSFINELGELDSETLENLVEKIETETAPIIKKILALEPLNSDERMAFAIFTATMMIRSPNHRRNIECMIGDMIKRTEIVRSSNKKAFKASVLKFEKDTGMKVDIPVEELRTYIQEGQYDLEVSPQISLSMSMSQLETLSKLFYDMNWVFFKATAEHHFLTGDNPLFYTDPTHDRKSLYGVGLANDNIEVTLALSKDMAAFGSWKNNKGYLQANNRLVKNINRRTVSAALRFVFASKQSTVLRDFVLKYRGSSPTIKIS